MIKDILEKHKVYRLDLELDLLRHLEQFRNKTLEEKSMCKDDHAKDILIAKLKRILKQAQACDEQKYRRLTRLEKEIRDRDKLHALEQKANIKG